jgi:signal transduction histidine kinase
MNLLLNAVQACAGGGLVRLRVTNGRPIRIDIADNGCGMSPEQLQRIFEPFVSMRQGGTGLGLFLSLNFARAWGGGISVTSAPGAGSTFTIAIPSVSDSFARPAAS